jgi:hypothetical protein
MVGSETESHVSSISPRTARIRELNDLLRKTGVGGDIMITVGVQALSPPEMVSLLNAIRYFERFDADNDPWFERDMGSMAMEGVRYFWKIDYYDVTMRGGSPDPTDPAVTRRVLTIMRSDEY